MYRKAFCLIVGFVLTFLLIRDASATLAGTTWEGDAQVTDPLGFWGDGLLIGGRLEFGTDGTFEVYMESASIPNRGEYVEWECGETDTCFIVYGSELFWEGTVGLYGPPYFWMTISQKFAGFGRVAGQNMDAFALVCVRVESAPLDEPDAIEFGLSIPIFVYIANDR